MIILDSVLDNKEFSVKVIDYDFIPKKGEVIQVRCEPFYGEQSFDVLVKEIKKDVFHLISL